MTVGINPPRPYSVLALGGYGDEPANPRIMRAGEFGLNPRVRQSGLGTAYHDRISKAGQSATPPSCAAQEIRADGRQRATWPIRCPARFQEAPPIPRSDPR
jgi:hypothetical protein